MADTPSTEALKALAEYTEKNPAVHVFVDAAEPLIWLVASLFTEQFMSKVSLFTFSNPYKSYDEFYEAIEAYIQSNSDAQKCLGEAHKAILEGVIQRHIRLVDDWGEFSEPELPVKVRSFSFYLWAERNGYVVPAIIMPLLRNLAGVEYNAKSTFEQREYQFPHITREQFIERCKEPLWRVDTGILYLLGRRSRAGKDADFIKLDKPAQKIQKYVFDAYKVGRIKLIFGKLDIEEWRTEADVLTAEVEPSQLVKLAKGFPVFLPMLEPLVNEKQKPAAVPQYVTDEMALMFAAVEKFWPHYDLSKPDPSKAPMKKDVVQWLRSEAEKRGFEISKTLAETMDTIMRCPKSRKGGSTT